MPPRSVILKILLTIKNTSGSSFCKPPYSEIEELDFTVSLISTASPGCGLVVGGEY